MSPCSPNDVSFPIPSGPSGPAIPGFGLSFSVPVPSIPFPDGFPEDLLDLLNKLQLVIPSGILKPALNPNFGKDIFDAIMKLLDQFFPFLMLYKFFLPVLNLIICIIEVICALMSPIALIPAVNRLFTQCIPAFLNLFPIFALIIMIISLLLLLIALIKYIIAQILKFINVILRNIRALYRAFTQANANSVLAIAKKLGALLCMFQNLFVLLSLFNIIIQVIKDILGMAFQIPPCESSGPGTTDGCCSPTTCPTIVQNPYTNKTGTFQYLNEAGIQTSLVIPGGNYNIDLRTESWQLYDHFQNVSEMFINIVDGYDVSPTVIPKPVFFPTDSNYSATTSPQQAAYTVDLRLLYNPSSWGRTGLTRNIRFKNCIVLYAPTRNIKQYDNSTTTESNGVLFVAGGLGYEDDGTTKLTGYAANGITPIPDQATLGNFIHKAPSFSPVPVLLPSDGHTFSNIEYTFRPNLEVLLQKNLVTVGCQPSVALSKAYINNVAFGDIALKTVDLRALLNDPNFPNPDQTQQCMSAAISGLRSNLTVEGVAEFQAVTSLCLSKLNDDTNNALSTVIGIGANPCTSKFSLSTDTQFTTKPITIAVNLNENNGLPLTSGIPDTVAQAVANKIKAYATFGTVGNFSYDGYQSFNADIKSDKSGSGELMISYQDNILCVNDIPANGVPTHTLQKLTYNFIYVPAAGDGKTRRDEGDTSRDGSD